MNFEEFELSSEVLKGVKEAGFKEASPIQQQAIPTVLRGVDVVAQAHTGTGKTAAFGLPIMSMMETDNKADVLVITPTRELAMQVSDELYKLGRFAGVRTVTIYGGQSYSRQIDQIKRGASIIVATPGRLLDLLESGRIEIDPNYVVLDEADEMLDMGFLEDINKIFSHLPEKRQTLLFSATMPEPIKRLSAKILKNPEYIQITERETTNKNISQEYYVVEEKERIDAVIRLMNYYDPEKSIIFCRMKREADDLAHNLTAKGYMAKALHGDMDQRSREDAIRAFKKGAVDTLVATDVAARGLDIQGVTHVFNYHIPFDPESYVHRIGRTGRAGKTGLAITLVTPMEFRELQRIKKIVGTTMEHKFVP
ncbi:MAG: DEAD/DEAH box helicase, partial [Campylobacterales bacterium]|nr:DEAD/DEAH box helicase [Campylobacterales bacterium]